MTFHRTLLYTVVLAVLAANPALGAGKKHRAKKPDYSALVAADQAAYEQGADPRGAEGSVVVDALTNLDQMPATAAGVLSTTLGDATPRAVLVSGSARDMDARFDLAVNNAPASQVFLQLGVGTGYSVLLSPELTGQVSIGLKNTTVPEAMEVMRELFGYDYRITGNRVFVYPNTVQTRIYRINYLPGRRQGRSELHVASSSVRNATSSASASPTATGANNGTVSGQSGAADETSKVIMSSDNDFWKEVQESLVSMVGTTNGRNVVMNGSAGVVVVRATPAEHRHVTDFLKAVQINIERQVMLEAKIVDVQLLDSAQTGVNWALFRGATNKVTLGNVAPGLKISGTTITNGDGSSVTPGTDQMEIIGKGFYGLAAQTANFAALINFLQTQGNVQVLSSPRIATMNNQKAVLKVGSDEVYATGLTITTTTAGNNTVSTPTPTFSALFSGISLDVTPQIDDTGAVMMHIHPAISNVTATPKTFDLGGPRPINLPMAVSTINETDSIVKVRDGHIVAIGGLMLIENNVGRSGLPGLSDVPVMGGLFRQKSTAYTKRELVVLIRPTVIGDDGTGWVSSEPSTPLINPTQ